MREVDRNLGLLEVAAMHARNLFREAVTGDAAVDDHWAIAEIARLAGEMARVAGTQREFFGRLTETIEADYELP